MNYILLSESKSLAVDIKISQGHGYEGLLETIQDVQGGHGRDICECGVQRGVGHASMSLSLSCALTSALAALLLTLCSPWSHHPHLPGSGGAWEGQRASETRVLYPGTRHKMGWCSIRERFYFYKQLTNSTANPVQSFPSFFFVLNFLL